MNTSLKFVFLLIFIFVCGIPLAVGQGASGTVTISYVLDRIQAMASNQIAVWIEDEDGNYVKSLFATKFSAEGGFKKRPDSLPEWVEKSGWENATQEEIDAVSGATPQSGTITVTWDLTDRTGKPVSPGTYVYKIEGVISWKNRVLWQGRIDVGGEENSSIAEATYFPPEAVEKVVSKGRDGKEQIIESVLVERVQAVYEPTK